MGREKRDGGNGCHVRNNRYFCGNMAKTGKHTIPAGVIHCQKECGCKYCEYVTTIEDEDIYLLSQTGDDEIPMPTGLPVFVLVKGDDCRVVSGHDALELLDILPEDEEGNTANSQGCSA